MPRYYMENDWDTDEESTPPNPPMPPKNDRKNNKKPVGTAEATAAAQIDGPAASVSENPQAGGSNQPQKANKGDKENAANNNNPVPPMTPAVSSEVPFVPQPSTSSSIPLMPIIHIKKLSGSMMRSISKSYKKSSPESGMHRGDPWKFSEDFRAHVRPMIPETRSIPHTITSQNNATSSSNNFQAARFQSVVGTPRQPQKKPPAHGPLKPSTSRSSASYSDVLIGKSSRSKSLPNNSSKKNDVKGNASARFAQQPATFNSPPSTSNQSQLAEVQGRGDVGTSGRTNPIGKKLACDNPSTCEGACYICDAIEQQSIESSYDLQKVMELRRVAAASKRQQMVASESVPNYDVRPRTPPSNIGTPLRGLPLRPPIPVLPRFARSSDFAPITSYKLFGIDTSIARTLEAQHSMEHDGIAVTEDPLGLADYRYYAELYEGSTERRNPPPIDPNNLDEIVPSDLVETQLADASRDVRTIIYPIVEEQEEDEAPDEE